MRLRFPVVGNQVRVIQQTRNPRGGRLTINLSVPPKAGTSKRAVSNGNMFIAYLIVMYVAVVFILKLF